MRHQKQAGRRRTGLSKEQRAAVATPKPRAQRSRGAGDRLGKLLGYQPGELQDRLRWLGELAESPSDGRLTNQGMAICDAFKALRGVWPEPYGLKYERKLLEAIDARDGAAHGAGAAGFHRV
jgi:hypothetical protein